MIARRAVGLWVALVAGCSSAPRREADAGARGRPYLVMVSFDAFRHDYLDRYAPPAFAEVARRGVRADALIPSFPSKTFPNHYTLVTGLYPGHHGIVGNTFLDPARGAWYRSSDPRAVLDSSWYGGEPIWVTAERSGVKSGAFFWPGSEAAIQGVRPTYYETFDGKMPNAARVTGAVAWLRKPPQDRPHLLLMYFNEVDDSSHKFGPDSPQAALAVASVDRALRQLLDSLHAMPFADSINLVLVSDHGMTAAPATRTIPVVDVLLRGGVDSAGIQLSDNGPVMSLWFAGDSARIRRARDVLRDGVANARTYLRSETPDGWSARGTRRFGDLLLVADEGYTLQRRVTDKAPNPGAHGYAPDVTSMRGIFLAAGPNVRPMRMPAFENVNVYPLLAALLRLDHPAVVDGRLDVLRGVLR